MKSWVDYGSVDEIDYDEVIDLGTEVHAEQLFEVGDLFDSVVRQLKSSYSWRRDMTLANREFPHAGYNRKVKAEVA